MQLGAFSGAQAISFEPGWDQNCRIGSIATSLTYTLSPSSTLRGVAGVGARDARADVYSSTTLFGALGYYRDLPRGFSMYVEPGHSRTRFHAPLTGFAATRRDEVWSAKVEVLNRRIEYVGFTPKFTFYLASQTSNIALYNYDRRPDT